MSDWLDQSLTKVLVWVSFHSAIDKFLFVQLSNEYKNLTVKAIQATNIVIYTWSPLSIQRQTLCYPRGAQSISLFKCVDLLVHFAIKGICFQAQCAQAGCNNHAGYTGPSHSSSDQHTELHTRSAQSTVHGARHINHQGRFHS